MDIERGLEKGDEDGRIFFPFPLGTSHIPNHTTHVAGEALCTFWR